MKVSHKNRARHIRRAHVRFVVKSLLNADGDGFKWRVAGGSELRVAPSPHYKGYQLLVLEPTEWYPTVYAKQSEAVSEGLRLFNKTAKRLVKKAA